MRLVTRHRTARGRLRRGDPAAPVDGRSLVDRLASRYLLSATRSTFRAKGVEAVLRSRIAPVLVLALILAACSQAAKPSATPTASVAGGEKPISGGTLTFIVNAEPPSFDGHRETTFALLHPIAPHYSTLYKFDPSDLTKVAADVAAAMPEVSADKLTYTIKLRTDVKFHDGSKMTSDDILATYQKIIFPPTGVLSPSAGAYAAVDTITAPAPDSVIFKLKYPSASFATNLASPWNFIYSAAKLKADIHWYVQNIMGTGPFTYEIGRASCRER